MVEAEVDRLPQFRSELIRGAYPVCWSSGIALAATLGYVFGRVIGAIENGLHRERS